MTDTRSAVLFSGGVGHAFEETSQILSDLINENGWDCHTETELESALASLADSGLLAVNALYWSMTQGEKYAPLRDVWAREISDDQIGKIEEFVCRGGRLFVLHTGVICWDTQPRWRDMMGGGWTWGVSHHPALGTIPVELTPEGSNLVDGPRGFVLIDEAYHNLTPADDCTILATADLGQGPQPLAWIRETGRGKVAVDALGHDRASLEVAGHHALIRGQLRWLAG